MKFNKETREGLNQAARYAVEGVGQILAGKLDEAHSVSPSPGATALAVLALQALGREFEKACLAGVEWLRLNRRAGWGKFPGDQADEEISRLAEMVLSVSQGGWRAKIKLLTEARQFSQAAAVLLDASATFCHGAAVFRVSGEDDVLGERIRGVDDRCAAVFASLKFPAREASAFAMVIEAGDPLAALGAPREISPALADLLAHPPDERVALFPICAGGRAAGVLYAWGDVQPAALELLAQAAGMSLETARTAEARTAGLVGIAPSPAPAKSAAPDWAGMPAAERQAHLRAQRFARVQVAEMRLYRPDAVASGRARRNLYDALPDAIDEAREAFRRSCIIPTPGMIDYLHEELVRTLANGDPAALGERYPGPLV